MPIDLNQKFGKNNWVKWGYVKQYYTKDAKSLRTKNPVANANHTHHQFKVNGGIHLKPWVANMYSRFAVDKPSKAAMEDTKIITNADKNKDGYTTSAEMREYYLKNHTQNTTPPPEGKKPTINQALIDAPQNIVDYIPNTRQKVG